MPPTTRWGRWIYYPSHQRKRTWYSARQYSVNGERRAFALLRSVLDAAAQDRLHDAILETYATFEQ